MLVSHPTPGCGPASLPRRTTDSSRRSSPKVPEYRYCTYSFGRGGQSRRPHSSWTRRLWIPLHTILTPAWPHEASLPFLLPKHDHEFSFSCSFKRHRRRRTAHHSTLLSTPRPSTSRTQISASCNSNLQLPLYQSPQQSVVIPSCSPAWHFELTVCSGRRQRQRQPHQFVSLCEISTIYRLKDIVEILTTSRFAPWWRYPTTGAHRARERASRESTHRLRPCSHRMYYLDPGAASYADPCQQIPNPSVAALYEDALVYETGSAITSSGALTAYSGAKTGRSPLDKRVVKEPSSENDIWVRSLSPVLYITLLTGVTVGSCQQAHDS
jgi:hypothetical protein